jgi:ABC-type phosphate transport system substrate-binding protein
MIRGGVAVDFHKKSLFPLDRGLMSIQHKSPRRIGRRLFTVLTVFATVLGVALPALALPPFADGKFNFTMTGAGSDTTYLAMQDMDKLFNQAPGCNLTVPPATPQWTCLADTATTVTTENYDHEMSVQHFPQGSGAGLRMLCQENDGLTGTIFYSFARSSSAPASIPGECQNASDKLTYVGWAKDAIAVPRWTGGPSDGVTNLTLDQLKQIFLGTGPGGCGRNWSEFGGGSGAIIVNGIQTSSGTYSAWTSFLGGDPNTCVSATGGQILFENNCTPINNLTADQKQRSIWALSFGKYTTGEADCSPTSTALISVGGVAPTATTIQNGTYQFNRTLFNVIRRNGPAWIAGYVGPAGWLCKANSLHSKPTADTGPGVENANVDRNWGLAIDKVITSNGFVRVTTSGDKCVTFDVNCADPLIATSRRAGAPASPGPAQPHANPTGEPLPSFVIGTGRCGSTLVHEVLARHPDVGFVSNLDDRYARCPGWIRRNSGLIYRWVPPWLTVKGRIRYAPSEAYSALAREVSPLLVDPARDLGRHDVTPWLAGRTRAFFESRAAAEGAPDYLHKLTGWPRAGFLAEIFPAARFVHVVRDGRAVANSWLQMPWWRGHLGPSGWHFGPLPAAYRMEWEAAGRDHVLLAGLGWKLLMDAYERARGDLREQAWLEVRYEDVVADPRKQFELILGFLGLPWTPGFERGFARHSFSAGRADAFRRDLAGDQLTLLDRSLGDHLRRYGYAC